MRDGISTSSTLLEWYDVHARVLPWRVPPDEGKVGMRPDPYRVWLSEVMLQQTTVQAVREKFIRFTTLWPDVAALAHAKDEEVMAEWAGLGYYARARNLLKCARFIDNDLGGAFPKDRSGLEKLPGIGPYTAAAIAAIAFDQAETVVDGNVERVVARLFNVHTPLPQAKPELTDLAGTLTPQRRPGDHAQAMMDLGATICTPRSPACGICPLMGICSARAAGTAAELPKKAPKALKPTRFGTAYVVVRDDGAVLLETRPPRGLLGGMLGWPCTEWSASPTPAPPVDAYWRNVPAEVRHTFTHFHLRLDVQIAKVTNDIRATRGEFRNSSDFEPSSLPTVMRKVWDVASSNLTGI